jgi:hypothetical protein
MMRTLLRIAAGGKEVTRIWGPMPFVLYDARDICRRMNEGVIERLDERRREAVLVEEWKDGKILYSVPSEVYRQPGL